MNLTRGDFQKKYLYCFMPAAKNCFRNGGGRKKLIKNGKKSSKEMKRFQFRKFNLCINNTKFPH